MNRIKVGARDINSISYKLDMSKKYADQLQTYRVYQVKEGTEFKPFEKPQYDALDDRMKAKYDKYFYGTYKGQNELGVPHGKGQLAFEFPTDVDETLEHLIRKEYRGEFDKGRFVHGYLSFMDNSYYIGDF